MKIELSGFKVDRDAFMMLCSTFSITMDFGRPLSQGSMHSRRFSN